MMGMKQLLYRHLNLPPLVAVWYRLIHELVGRLLLDLWAGRRMTPRRRRCLAVAGVVVSLGIQIVLIILVQQLVDLCISLMEVWAELAAKHLEITLDRTS
jgi:hypothetical protein